MERQHLVLYDGVCGLCNRLVRFILARDRQELFHFATIQGDFGRALLSRHGRNPSDLDAAYVVLDYRSSTSTLISGARAAVFVLTALGGWWRVPALVGWLPDGLLDWGYSAVARNRYRLFGRAERCRMPGTSHRGRFIDL